MTRQLAGRSGAAIAAVLSLVLAGGSAAFAAAGQEQAGTAAAAPRVQCVARTHAYDALADKMARHIDARLAGRVSAVGLMETDSKTGVTCQYHATWHFYAASVMKVTILSALLRVAQGQHRHLTSREQSLAWVMITQSDNNAASALWNEVGLTRMQQFLNTAGMRQTRLSGAWGLTLITAHDEARLLWLLSEPNTVLNRASRVYARNLMAHVIASQRWGTPAGAPRDVTVHVKNGWLPYPGSNWEINSLGIFTDENRAYRMAILTYDNPSMGYGIDTIQGAAEVIHADLNPGEHAAVAPTTSSPSWGVPDEPIPHPGR
jgi:beta-lactamase family protein